MAHTSTTIRHDHERCDKKSRRGGFITALRLSETIAPARIAGSSRTVSRCWRDVTTVQIFPLGCKAAIF
jgi:hypothetical protein